MALCVKDNEVVGDEYVGRRSTGFDEMGVKRSAFWEVSLLGVVDKFLQKGSALRRREGAMIHKLILLILLSIS